MIQSIEILILDFDRTITQQHTGGCANIDQLMPPQVLENVKEGFADFVQLLLAQNIKLYIATYGDDRSASLKNDVAGHALIKRYMDVIFGDNQRLFKLPLYDANRQIIDYHNIIARLSQDNKDFHLNIIAEQERLNLSDKSTLQKVLLIDDDKPTTKHFKQAGCKILARKPGTAAKLAAAPDLFLRLIEQFTP